MRNISDIESMAAALYDGGWRADERDQLISEYDLSEADAEAICAKLAEYDRRWYAVQTDDNDSWDNGSYDLDEAKQIARDAIAAGNTGVKIAAIANGNYCEEEILPEDF